LETATNTGTACPASKSQLLSHLKDVLRSTISPEYSQPVHPEDNDS